MEPVAVLYSYNGNSLTLSIGWQTNFAPLERKMAFELHTATRSTNIGSLGG